VRRQRSEVKLVAQSGGNLYLLNEVCGYILKDYDGLGTSQVRRLSQRGPGQQGDTDLGFAQEPRFINLGWIQQGQKAASLWELRRHLLGVFRPRTNDPVILTFTFPGNIQRAAGVYLEGELDHKSGDRMDGRTQRVLTVLKASDPRLYDPRQQRVSLNLITSTSGWEIDHPTAPTGQGWLIGSGLVVGNPDGWPIGQSAGDLTLTIFYANGALDADIELPVIRLFGPAASPTISNLTTDEHIPLTDNGGLSIGAGQFVEIDLAYGRKTIKDQDGVAVDQYLDPDNDLATWHLSYNTELLASGGRSDGNNVIRVTADGVSSVTRLEVIYYDRYIGV
jgi:hypothetical protein